MEPTFRIGIHCLFFTNCCEIAKNLHKHKLLFSDSIKFTSSHLEFIKPQLIMKNLLCQARQIKSQICRNIF